MTEKVLIVDDSSFMRRVLRKELEQAGFEVFEAENGLSALKIAADIRPSLITMDVDMPKINGYEAVEKIRSDLKLMTDDREREVPIIFITSNDSLEGRKKGFQVGASDFIVKPFLKGEVAATAKGLIHPAESLQGMTALVVEDSAITARLTTNVLNNEGLKTLVAGNGREALDIFTKHEETIDLVLTDFIMPEMNGDELCRKIRIDLGHRSLPIIFLSSLSEVSSVINIFKAGASDYVVKPFVKEEFLARVKVHLEMRRLNKSLSRQVHEHKRLNKLKDDILSVTSHDLRSPLNGILGFTDLLINNPDLNDTHQEYLGHIRDSGEFLLTLINDILDLGMAQSESHELEMNMISVNELIVASLNTVQHMATPKEIDLRFENLCSKTPYILGDKNALIRIFNNLLSNAIKFTHNNGTVKVATDVESDETLRISIEDNGIGIPADKIDFLFDKFSKASRTGTSGEKSTGLGLSITRELIERHKGTIEITSEEGKGSCFTMHFPLIVAEGQKSEPDDPADEMEGNLSDNGVRILVVDDNLLNIKLAVKLFEQLEYQIQSANNGQEALDLFVESNKDGNDAFDAIFMDIQMPVMDGFEATARIREFEKTNHLPSIPIIAMTAGTDEFWKERCQEMGLTGTVTKPIDKKQINGIVRTFLFPG